MRCAGWKQALALVSCLLTAPLAAVVADQTQWGQKDSRNMVSEERGLPVWFEPGRRADQRWYDYGASADRDRYTYGYDRASNRLYRENTTTGTNWADPAHDRAGNMTTIPKPASLADGLTAVDDAWNRLVEIQDGETVIAHYHYDALNRRIRCDYDSAAPDNPAGVDTYVHDFYNSQ